MSTYATFAIVRKMSTLCCYRLKLVLSNLDNLGSSWFSTFTVTIFQKYCLNFFTLLSGLGNWTWTKYAQRHTYTHSIFQAIVASLRIKSSGQWVLVQLRSQDTIELSPTHKKLVHTLHWVRPITSTWPTLNNLLITIERSKLDLGMGMDSKYKWVLIKTVVGSESK